MNKSILHYKKVLKFDFQKKFHKSLKKMDSTTNNQTLTGDSIYSIELIPYLILNAIGIVVGAIGKLKIRNKLIKKDFLILI
jgi:hypothetical protein